MDEQPKKRNPFLTLIPYLLIGAIAIALIFYFITSSMSVKTVWSESDLDTYFRYEFDTTENEYKLNTDYSAITSSSATKDKYYYVQSWSESKSYDMTTVTMTVYQIGDRGTPLTKTTAYAYVSNVRIEDSFEAEVFVNGTAYATTHASYATILNAKVSEWNDKIDSKYFEQFNLTQRELNSLQKGGVTVENAYQVSWWDAWGPTIIELILLIAIGGFLFSRLAGAAGGANRQAMDFNKSPARKETSKVKFDDVAGCDEEKAEMVEMVAYLKEPKKYSAFGARLPKGVLLVGAPGTGKTLLAKATAGEAGVPFFSISGSDFVEMFVGVGAGRVRDLFKKAKANAPCIIFIDEIDAVGRQRGAGLGGGNDEREQTLNQLLVEMDGFAYNAGILVMAATNRDDVLDPALMRPGRFDRIITVNLPDAKGREAIFKVHARNKKISPEVNFETLAKRTVGFSGADIDNILNEAAILAVRFHKNEVGMAEIEEAIDRRIAGVAKNGKGMNEMERKQVAYHEAGHAVIGLTLPYSEKVQKITIIPRGRTGGHVQMMPQDDRFLLTKKELLAEITGLLGGRASEEIFFDDISSGASNDIEKATRIARSMVTEWGMSDLGPIQYEHDTGSVFLGRDYANTQKNFSAAVADEIDKAVREIVEKAHKEALDIISSHKEQVTLIAETLLAQETITSDEIESLVKTGKLPEKEQASVKKVDEEPQPTVEEKPTNE